MMSIVHEQAELPNNKWGCRTDSLQTFIINALRYIISNLINSSPTSGTQTVLRKDYVNLSNNFCTGHKFV